MRIPVWLVNVVLTLAVTVSAQTAVPFLYQPPVPATVAPGSPSFNVRVSGTGFASGSTVYWNGRPLSTRRATSTTLIAHVPFGLVAQPTTGILTVVNPGSKISSNPVLLPVVTPEASINFKESSLTGFSLPQEVALADFNGDGKLDFASTIAPGFSASSADVFVVGFSNGDGTFRPLTVPTGPCPIGIATGDFNGDGLIDIAVVLNGVAKIEVFLQQAKGGFRATNHVSVSTSPFAVVTADFNQDGKLDLAYLATTGNVAGILLGDGLGGFSAGQTITAAGQPEAITVGDFNGDNVLDLAIANNQNVLSIFFGDGTGHFGNPTNYTVGSLLRSLAVADLNGDGVLDIVASDGLTNSIDVLLGNADGSFQTATNYATGMDPLQIVIADLDGDGKLDLATANLFAGVSVLRGNGDGTFQAQMNYFPTASAVALAAGDFKIDGRLDLVVPEVSNLIDILTQ